MCTRIWDIFDDICGTQYPLAARGFALWFLYCFRPAKVILPQPLRVRFVICCGVNCVPAHRKAKVPLGGAYFSHPTLAEDHFAVGFSTDEDNTDKFTGIIPITISNLIRQPVSHCFVGISRRFDDIQELSLVTS